MLDYLPSISTEPSKEKVIVDCIEFVQDNITYLFSKDIMDGLIPQNPEKTLETKSGDCKAKSLLLLHILKTISIKSEILLVNTFNDFNLKDLRPSPFYFNHAIIQITKDNGATVLVDPTQSNRKGDLDFRTEPIYHSYLKIDGKSPLTFREEVFDYTQQPSLNYFSRDINLTLTTKDIFVSILVTISGSLADRLRNAFSTQEEDIKDWNDFVLKSLQLDKNQPIIQNPTFKIIYDDKKHNKIVHEYTSTVMLSPANSIVRFYPAFLEPNFNKNILNEEIFNSNIFYDFYDTITLKTKGLVIKNSSVPKKLKKPLDNMYFRYTVKEKLKWNKIVFSNSFTKKGVKIINKNDYDFLNNQLKTIEDSNYGTGAYFQRQTTLFFYILLRFGLIAFWFLYIFSRN